jgi:hypothetical protein
VNPKALRNTAEMWLITKPNWSATPGMVIAVHATMATVGQ